MVKKYFNKRGERACFDTEKHQYWQADSKFAEDINTRTLGEMIPVTRLIGQFYSVSPWQGEKCDVAFGNKVHAVAAACLLGNNPSVSPSDDHERASFSAVWQYAKRLMNNNQICGVEEMMFSAQMSIAGTIDLAFDCNDKTFVCDWKTGNVMLPAKTRFNAPFEHLMADPLTIYSLQLSMYQVLFDIGGYQHKEFAAARLLWLHDDENGKPKIDALTCRDLRREAAMMITMKPYTPWHTDWLKRCPF